MMQMFVVVGLDVAAREDVFEVLREGRIDRHQVFKLAVDRALLCITILPSFSTIMALISPAFSFFRISTGNSPLMILLRMSGTHLGHSESVSRGHPSFGFCFSQLFRSGLSDTSA